MYCYEIIHVESDEVIRCYKQIKELSVSRKMLMENNHVIVGTNCGQVDGYEPVKEFCSFFDNKCK